MQVRHHAARGISKSMKVSPDTEPRHRSGKPRVYLGGPDVFFPNAKVVGRAKVKALHTLGLDGVFPLDADLDLTGLAPIDAARRISTANEGLMRDCDAMIANLSPFRGVSMDSGTAFEVGFMRARGVPIAGYTTAPADYADRARDYRDRYPEILAYDIDRPDFEIEDFNLTENLMIAIAIEGTVGGVDQAVGQDCDSIIAGFDAFMSAARRVAVHFDEAETKKPNIAETRNT